MKMAVIIREVPDIVEELVIAEDGRSLDKNEVKYVANELDEHALEQALIAKENHSAHVTAMCVGGEEARDALATSVARGADEAVYVPLLCSDRGDCHKLAAHLAPIMEDGGYDIVFTGVQSVDQLDGCLGGLLAARLGMPYVGGLMAVEIDPSLKKAVVKKDYPGGRLAVMEVDLPAVLGIQSAERPPRYVPVSRFLQIKKTMEIKEVRTPPPKVAGISVTRLLKPEAASRAKMIEGDEGEVATIIVALLKERGLL